MKPLKQRAAELLRKGAGEATIFMAFDLLQELVNESEPEPVLVVGTEPGYWTRGHYCEGTKSYIDPTKVWGLPAGTKLYTVPPAPSAPDWWRAVIVKEFPLYDEDGIDEDKHCCEWVMLQERKRLHKILATAAPTPAEPPADVARDVRLQVESEFAAMLPGVTYMDEPDGGSPSVQEQVKRMARDAERYRWLLENARATAEHWGGRWSLVIDSPAPGKDASSEAINAAIDAARKRQGGE